MVTEKRSRVGTPLMICLSVVVVVTLGCLLFLFRNNSPRYEHFANPSTIDDILFRGLSKDISNYKKTWIRTPENIYDTFYSKIYKKMISEYKILLAEKEIRDLGLNTRLKEYGKRASVLDLGCGDGFHLEQISRGYSCEITGLDISRDMLDMSSKRFQKLGDKKHSLRLLQNDFEDENAVGSRRFTHICMYYFSFYYSSNQEKLVQNIHTWLEPKGYFAVHLVHPTKFDPIIDAANPFVGFSLNHYRKNDPDAKHSRVYFQNFVYNSPLFVPKKGRCGTIHTPLL
jgi:SAM-dependent methyltransferase